MYAVFIQKIIKFFVSFRGNTNKVKPAHSMLFSGGWFCLNSFPNVCLSKECVLRNNNAWHPFVIKAFQLNSRQTMHAFTIPLLASRPLLTPRFRFPLHLLGAL